MYGLLLAAAVLGQQPNRQDFQVLGPPAVQVEAEAQRNARLQEEAKEIKLRRENNRLERERREKQAEVERLQDLVRRLSTPPPVPTPTAPQKEWLMGVINGQVMWIWGWKAANGQIAWLPNDVPAYPAPAPQPIQIQVQPQPMLPLLQIQPAPVMLQLQPMPLFQIP